MTSARPRWPSGSGSWPTRACGPRSPSWAADWAGSRRRPPALAFGIRVLADPRVRAEVAELGRRLGRIAPPPARALDFEQERALRLMRLDQPGAVSPRRPGGRA